MKHLNLSLLKPIFVAVSIAVNNIRLGHFEATMHCLVLKAFSRFVIPCLNKLLRKYCYSLYKYSDVFAN